MPVKDAGLKTHVVKNKYVHVQLKAPWHHRTILIYLPGPVNSSVTNKNKVCYNRGKTGPLSREVITINHEPCRKKPDDSPEGNFFDLAVIGAGPAGSLSAALAADFGLSTVIIEQKKLPRLKPCGGFVSARSLSLLPDDLRLPPESIMEIKKIVVVSGGRHRRFSSTSRLGLLIKRTQFDYTLARYAVDKGAVLLENHALDKLIQVENGNPGPGWYKIETTGDTFPLVGARYVIGADGALSRLARLSGLRKSPPGLTGWGMSTTIEPSSLETETGTLFFYPRPFLGGMGWSFHGSGWANRGIGGLAGRRLLQKAYCRIFSEKAGHNELHAWPLPFAGPLKKAARGNLFLTGDAAGLVEPFSGEGLYNSLKSARLAFLALVGAEKEKSSAGKIYQDLFNDHFRKNFAGSLAGAVLLHGRFICNPSSLPRLIAALMENKLWFNRAGEFYWDSA